MFTGLVEKLGLLQRVERRGDGARVTIQYEAWDQPLVLGESIAVQGVCLTVAECSDRSFSSDVLYETLQRSTLGAEHPGANVNLERALCVGDRLGGHFVTGHVDGQGKVSAIRRAAEDWVLELSCETKLLNGCVQKGSVACDGVSLTVTRVTHTSFQVHIIPHTWDNTTLRELKAGSPVNIETDVMGKYAARYAHTTGSQKPLTLDELNRAGFFQ